MSNSVASTNSTASKPPGHDIFCTPENSEFVSKVPYRSLSKTDHEIRLLKILPDSGSGFVECELLPAVSLATVHNQYLALSYCAGSAENTKPIKVNGVNSNVFANLHHALTCARHYWETHAELPEFLLWVDQICINQFDLAERSHQVGFMRDIYHNAKRTLICLSASETDWEGMRWLVELNDTVAQETIMDLALSIAAKSDTDHFAKGLAEFSNIATSPWWRRAWVFQEFMVSTDATFLYGRHAMPHGDFRKLAMSNCSAIWTILCGRHSAGSVRQKLKKSLSINGKMSWPYNRVLSILMARQQEPTPTDLETLLNYTRACQASNPKDKIYSVLGLANSGYGIMPDYSPENDNLRLLVETTRRIIAFKDSLSILSNLERIDTPMKEREQLPSWVVDWIQPGPCKPTYLMQKPTRKFTMYYFTDHKITGGSIDACFETVPDPGSPGALTTILKVWAIRLDTDFQKVGGRVQLEDSGGSSERSSEGSQHYVIDSKVPLESGRELWILCGALQPFILSRYSYGYRVFKPIFIFDIMEDGVMKFPQFMDDQGMYDESKMDWRRITIF